MNGLVERPGSTYGGEVPRCFCIQRERMLAKELSIFVDESGDFGPYEYHCPFYIFTLVFHDQSNPIADNITRLEHSLKDIGLDEGHCFHVGPIIRREEDYQLMDVRERRRVLGLLIAFVRNINISYATFSVEKKQVADSIVLTARLSRCLSAFIRDNFGFFQQFDRVVVYYDNGQVELGRILASVFSILLSNVEFKKVKPAQYRLFQVADLMCTMELLKLKQAQNMLSKSEDAFFGSARDMKKNYLKQLDRHLFKKMQE